MLSQPLPVTAAPRRPLGSRDLPKLARLDPGSWQSFRWPAEGLELALSPSHFSREFLNGPLSTLNTKQKNTPLSKSEKNPDLPFREVALALAKTESQFNKPPREGWLYDHSS